MKPRRSTAQISRDRRRTADMYLRGMLEVDIGEELGTSQSTVSRDLAALEAQWRAESIADIGQMKAIELARIGHIEATYWEAWLASVADPDPRYLSGVAGCIDRRIKLLGLDAPTRARAVVLTDAEGNEPEEEHELSAEEIVAMREFLDYLEENAAKAAPDASTTT